MAFETAMSDQTCLQLLLFLQMVHEKKNGSDRISNFTSHESADSVPDPQPILYPIQ